MEFKEMYLIDCVNDIIDYRGKTPKKLKDNWSEDGDYRAISAKNIKNMNLVNQNSMNKAKASLYKKWMKKEIDKGDILLTSEAPLGETLYWDFEEKIILSQRVFGLKANNEIVNSKYLFAYMQTPFFKHELFARESGTTVTGIRRKELEKVIIKVPSMYIQNYIGKIIYNINYKINNNNKIIANLEELSQTLFKRWFVDFEFPDENGNPYKSSGGEMIDSELGEIPKNWNVLTINDFADDLIITGKTPSTKNKDNYSEKGIPFLTIPDMHTDVFSLNTIKYISEVGIEKVKNKIIPENSLCVSCIATPGLVSITSSETLTNQQINSFTPKKNDLYYLYFYIKNMKKYIEDLGSGGSATLNLNKTQFSKIKIIRPINDLLKKFHKCVDSNFKIILTKQKENLKLQELRDTLLPKLMFGELEIPDDVEVNTDELSI
ncbi:restriction endonuclease subunit S [Staphylococcus hominis]|uniref:restriction endonuclease subunit S n=1 Tax=Staphylococcus hominis TaxID=1290 RepID=UPI0006B8D57E|nr:restriction endonuclease subunit S [Staphylococcus hominis]KPG88840.1 type I restriction endonuclease subunit S [Staphylococcus hominis]MCI2918719.1 restriction endonuclease subunit S [Staphylococcus hominis]MDS3926922.1 restriction endonuclease subunit S [Staphylococcus hominis]UQA65790.1 restriction endonuclease subunit S [Staphylococcus hominis subsp. hominis]